MNPLFKDIPPEALKTYLAAIKAHTAVYQKDSFLFFEGDIPKALFILTSGSVQIEKNSPDGKRTIMNRFESPNTVFGEVYAFLQSVPYDYSCRIISNAEILSIPVSVFSASPSVSERVSSISAGNIPCALGSVHTTMLKNLLYIIAHKAYFLNQKLLIFSSFTLRKKIALYLLQQSHGESRLTLSFNREALAEYLAVPRPSLSRELMRMQKDKLISIAKDTITVDRNKLEDLV